VQAPAFASELDFAHLSLFSMFPMWTIEDY
jgi:hypothetical protein